MAAKTHAARKAEVKSKVGDAEVKSLVLDLTRLDEEGVFITVSAGGTTRLQTVLNFQTLGIDGIPKDLAVSIGSPNIGLLPNEYRLNLTTRVAGCYSAIRRHGLQFSVAHAYFGRSGHRWVPGTALDAFLGDFQTEANGLQAAKNNAIEHYDEIIETLTGNFHTLAADAKVKLVRQGVDLPEDFVGATVAALLAKVPTKEFIREEIYAKFQVGILQFGSELFEERTRTAEARRQELEVNKDVIAHEAVIYEKARALRLEETQRRKFVEEELRKEAEANERMRKLKMEAAKEQLEGAVSPIKETIEQLHLTLNGIATEMATSIAKNGFIHGATAERARELSEWFRKMNWTNDIEMEEAVNWVGQLASSAPEQRDPLQFSDAVDRIIAMTKAEAESVSRANKWSALEV